MVHRALFGSIERFTAMLLEHFNGEFPFWLSPVQARILTVSDEHQQFASSVYSRLKEEGYRVELDDSNEPLGAKIRNAEISKIPVTIIIGSKEQQASSVTVRTRQDKKQQFLSLDSLLLMLSREQSVGKAEYIHNGL